MVPNFVKENDNMNSQRRYYIEKIALDARKRLVAKGIIAEDQKILKPEHLEAIITFYGGELKLHDVSETFIEKTSNDSFTIYYSTLSNYLHVIHELGHAFLNLDDMEVGDKCYFDGFGANDTEASLFARAFVMPRSNFEQVVIDHLNDGKFSIQNVAEEYQIDYLEVLARGEELNIGN